MTSERRRGDDRRTPGRRLEDRMARERARMLSWWEEPARVAVWEIEWRRAEEARKRHLGELRGLAQQFG